jgi:hypothetical protein
MVDFKELAFIAKSPDAQLLLELDIANERYDFFRMILESRNAAIETYLRHPETKIITFNDKTGAFAAEGLKHLQFNVSETNRAAVTSLEKAKRANKVAIDHLWSFAQKEFPGRRILHASENASSENAGAMPPQG